MWLSRTSLLLALLALSFAEKSEQDDVSSAFIEEAKNLFNQKSLESMAHAFANAGAGKQLFEKRSGEDGISQIISGMRSLMSGEQHNQGSDALVGSILSAILSMNENAGQRSTRDTEHKKEQGINWENVISMGSMFFQQKANSDTVMGLVPMVLEALGHGTSDDDAGKQDHSSHSWYMPPILENIHVMWEHFSNSELGQTLWKNSGLSKIVTQMSDEHGNVDYTKVLDSFESPRQRRRWIRSFTNYVADWISHISDPMIQQRYLATAQFVGNSFLKSQGFPRMAMFDAARPKESIIRFTDTLAGKYLHMNINSSQYIGPAVAYLQELTRLASEKGFIRSRVNARELSNKLSDVFNNDIIAPMLKAYRAYKWATKVPHCASQILCTINEKSRALEEPASNESRIRSGLLRVASFPAAWAVSNKLNINFWSLYGAIMETEGCITKYPADCTAFHEEEIRVTTENIHSEL